MKKQLIIIFIFIINITLSNAQNLDSEKDLKLHNYQIVCLSRNDSIFTLCFFPKIESYDSTSFVLDAVKLEKNRWIDVNHTDSTYTIVKYRKKIKSQWFKKNNGKLFNVYCECEAQRYWIYKPNNEIVEYVDYWIFSNVKIKKKSTQK